jgi:general secretion pathway protein J
MSAGVLSRKNSGFTLLEVLLAVFIFAIVIVAVYGAYITAITAVDTTEIQADINNRARTALERITADLGGLYLGEGGSLNGHKQEIGGNRADTLDFTSTVHLAFTRNELPAGFGMIRYLVRQEGDKKILQLYRSDLPFRPGLEQAASQEKGYLLCDGLHAVRFTYYDQTGSAADDWQMAEDADPAMERPASGPAMIEIALHFADDNGRDQIFKTAVAVPVPGQRGR